MYLSTGLEPADSGKGEKGLTVGGERGGEIEFSSKLRSVVSALRYCSPLSPATPCFAALEEGDDERRRRDVDGVAEAATARVRVAAVFVADERERAPKAERAKGADTMMTVRVERSRKVW